MATELTKVVFPTTDYIDLNKYRLLTNNDFDTINVTELNAGDLIVTGGARFLNTINGDISGNSATATTATTASKLGSSNVGSATQPIYLSSGTATACTYSLNKTVPSDAVFTDHYDWADITNKPVTFITNSGALATNGWKTLGGRSSGNKIAISYASSSPATWNSESYSASIVFGCSDTKGLVDCGYSNPIVTFGGGSVNGSTDNAPIWYFRITGTSTTTYNLNNLAKVTQTAVTAGSYTNWRPLVIGSSNSATEGFTPSTVTDTTITASTISCQPSTGTIRATTFKGALNGNANTATKATQDGSGNTITSTYLKLSGGTMTGGLGLVGNQPSAYNDKGIVFTNGSRIGENTGGDFGIYAKNGFYLRPGCDNSPSSLGLIISADGTTTVSSSFTAGTSITASTTVAAASGIIANSGNSGTAGGVSLYGTSPTAYGIAMRGTGNGGKHGAVQGDWAIYSYMNGYNTARGWIWRNSYSNNTNIASLDVYGNAVFNGYVGIGGNETNTSGVRQVYNSTTKSLDFVFVA